jgi:pSer/pThr/pTyr-binding forkhead associated (FHA) protein
MDVGLVCDECSAFNAMGVQQCVRCGSDVSLDATGFDDKTNVGPGPAKKPAPEKLATQRSRPLEPVATDNPCPTCGEQVIVGHRFCGNCGGKMPEPGAPRGGAAPAGSGPAGGDKSGRRTMYFGAIQAARAKLTVIRGDGLDGVSFSLAGEEHLAGRLDCPLVFPDDPFLSPVHCNFFYRTGQLVVRDERSINGVYVRISGSKPVPFGARFLVGEQLLEVEEQDAASEEKAVSDGTYFFASPRRPSRLRLVQRLRGGDSGIAHRATGEVVTIGREGNDIDFPDDPFISGHHARLTWDGHTLILTDLNSKNGTFLRVVGEQALGHGDYVFMGQQLLRVEVV